MDEDKPPTPSEEAEAKKARSILRITVASVILFNLILIIWMFLPR